MESAVSVSLDPSALPQRAAIHPHHRLVAHEARIRQASRGYLVTVLDGDTIRAGLNSDLDFTARSREENLRRAGEVTSLFANAGHIVIATFVSPHRPGH